MKKLSLALIGMMLATPAGAAFSQTVTPEQDKPAVTKQAKQVSPFRALNPASQNAPEAAIGQEGYHGPRQPVKIGGVM